MGDFLPFCTPFCWFVVECWAAAAAAAAAESRLAEGQQLYNTRVGMVWTWRTVASWSCLHCVVDLQCLCTLDSSRANFIHIWYLNFNSPVCYQWLRLETEEEAEEEEEEAEEEEETEEEEEEWHGGVCGWCQFCGCLFNQLMRTTNAPITARSVAD